MIHTRARSRKRGRTVAATLAAALVLAACGNGNGNGDGDGAANGDDGADDDGVASEEVTSDVGVDLDNQVLTIGALNDLSGPGAGIGVPFAVGKRILVEQVNAGGSGLLPDGWTIELVEEDHGYNPQESVQAFNQTVDEVLFYATVFGTPNTLPLVDLATNAEAVIFPASLSSELAVNEYTPPIGSPYKVEAHHGVDWAVEDGGDDLALGLVYQLDDYGQDAVAGVTEAAEHHGIEVVASEGVAPGEADVTATVTALQNAGATHVVLATLPTATGPILGTAAQLGYGPTWIGLTPAWIDRFFDPETLPSQVWQNFVWVTGLPLWGEDLPGMADFLAAYEEFGTDDYAPDFYILASYSQGLLALEAFNRALDNGDVTRSGYFEALRSITDYDANGLWVESVDMDTFPYETLTDTRVLRPGEDLESWEVVSDFATPDSYAGLGVE